MKHEDLKRFIDYENAVRRVRMIANDNEKTFSQRELANELLVAIEQGKDK